MWEMGKLTVHKASVRVRSQCSLRSSERGFLVEFMNLEEAFTSTSEHIWDNCKMRSIYTLGSNDSEATTAVRHVKPYPGNFIAARHMHAFVFRWLLLHKSFTSGKHLCGPGIMLSTGDNTAADEWNMLPASETLFQNAKSQKIQLAF